MSPLFRIHRNSKIRNFLLSSLWFEVYIRVKEISEYSPEAGRWLSHQKHTNMGHCVRIEKMKVKIYLSYFSTTFQEN